MTTTVTRNPAFATISGMSGPNLSPLYAMADRSVLAASISGSVVQYLGESAALDSEPTAVENTSSPFHVLTSTGITRMTVANSPAIVDRFLFKSGGGRWLALFSTNFLATPLEKGGVQVIHKTTGAVLSSIRSLTNDSRFAAFYAAQGYLWVVDGVTATIKTLLVNTTTGVLTYIGSVAAPNCKDIIKVVLDSNNGNLFVVCRNRIVRFTVPVTSVTDTDTIRPVFADNYGTSSVAYTDLVVIAANKYWIGQASSEFASPLDEYYGPMYGVWDSGNAQLIVAAPQGSVWTVNNAIPYYTATTVDDTIVPPSAPPAPPVVAPAAPVITSALTASVVEDTLFSYTITATGTGPIYYDVINPPYWLTSINHITGAISGTPADPATVNITITATNAGGTDTETLVVTIANAVGDLSAVSVNAEVFSVTTYNNLVYVIGQFTSVTDSSGTYARNYSACLNVTTGLWTSWNPTFGTSPAQIAKVYADSSGTYIYITNVTTINGSASNNLRRVDAITGATDAGWLPASINSDVYGLVIIGSTVYVSGAMTTPGFGGAQFALSNGAFLGALSAAVSNNSGGSCVYDGARLWHGIGAIPTSVASGYAGGGLSQVFHGINMTSAERFLGMAHSGGVILGVGDFVNRQAVALPSGTPTGTNYTYAAMWSSGNGALQGLTALDAASILFECCTHPAGGFLACGSFAIGASRGVVRLTTAGAIDTSFSLTWSLANPGVRSVANVLGAIVFAGSFTGTINGSTRTRIAVANAATGVLY